MRKVEQSEDYGIDYEVEVFSDEGGKGRSTGFMFKVQLKSSAEPAYAKSTPTVSVSVKKKHISYWCDELDVPVILAHADVTAGRLFWFAPQLQRDLQHQGDPKSSEKVSLQLPVENELPATLQRMLRVADKAAAFIATRKVVSTPIPELISALRPEDCDEELARSLRDRSDAVRLAQLQQFFTARNHVKAEEIINKILQDSETSVENKFWALLEKERVTFRKLVDAGAPQAHAPDAALEIAKGLQTITESGPPALKFAALIMRKSAELEVLTQRTFGLFMNYKGHQRAGKQIWETYALLEKTRTEMQVRKKYNQCVRLAQYASTSKHRSATGGALIRIIHGLVTYLIVLDSEGNNEQALQYRKSAFQVLQLAAWIAQRIDDYTTVTIAASNAIQLAHSDFQEPAAWAERLVATIDDPSARDDAQNLISRAKARKNGIPQDGDIPATEQQIYENMAAALGIPLDEPNHILTKMFRAGVKDADPTPVLRHCKHSSIRLARVSMFQHMLGEQLGLPIGPKVFECALHGYSFIAGSMDAAYREFNSRYCQSCPDRDPQTDGWKFSREWQSSQYDRVREAKRKRYERLEVERQVRAAAQYERVREATTTKERAEVPQPIPAAEQEIASPAQRISEESSDEDHKSQR